MTPAGKVAGIPVRQRAEFLLSLNQVADFTVVPWLRAVPEPGFALVLDMFSLGTKGFMETPQCLSCTAPNMNSED